MLSPEDREVLNELSLSELIDVLLYFCSLLLAVLDERAGHSEDILLDVRRGLLQERGKHGDSS